MKLTVPLEEFCRWLGLPALSEIEETNAEYIDETGYLAYSEAAREGLDPDKAEDAAIAAQDEALSEIAGRWENAVAQAIEQEVLEFPGDIDVSLEGVRLTGPRQAFKRLGNYLLTLVSGFMGIYYAGIDEYMDIEGEDLLETVGGLLHWVGVAHRVYGGPPPGRIFEAYF